MIYENTALLFDRKNFPYASIMLSSCDNVEYHCHKEAEIVFQISGTLEVLYNQHSHQLQAGDVFIIPPYISHALINPSKECTRLVHVVDFSISSINTDYLLGHDIDFSFINLLQQIEAHSRFWPETSKNQITEILQNMHYEYSVKSYAWEISITVLASQFILICLRHLPTRKDAFTNHGVNKLQAIIHYIATNFNQRLSLQECAKTLGFHPSYLSRYFKKHMGITFQDYIKNSRIEKSKILLLSSHISITDVCYEAGFTDLSTFNKLFKSSVGCSPSEYRKENYFIELNNYEVNNYTPKAF